MQLPFLAPEELKPLTKTEKASIKESYRISRGNSVLVAQQHGINEALVDAVVFNLGYIRLDGIKLC